jgi:hypothetical protein
MKEPHKNDAALQHYYVSICTVFREAKFGLHYFFYRTVYCYILKNWRVSFFLIVWKLFTVIDRLRALLNRIDAASVMQFRCGHWGYKDDYNHVKELLRKYDHAQFVYMYINEYYTVILSYFSNT